MGVCELNPSNEFFQEISNPIKMNINSPNTTDTKSKSSTNSNKNNIQKNNNNDINKFLDTNSYLKKNDKKKKLEIKSRIINTNKINNYIFKSKSNYSNYKRVPHLKSHTNSLLPTEKTEKKDNNIKNNNQLLMNKINTEENILWFKTQNNFNNIEDNSSNDYNKKNNKNFNNELNNKRNNLNIYISGKNQFNSKSNNKSNIIYTKAFPMDNINEKKLEYLFIIKNNCKEDISDNLLYAIEKENFFKNENINGYSTKKDYKNIIKRFSNNKYILSNYLLELKERKWYNELIDITNLLMDKREENEILISNKYIRKVIKLQEHFNWLVESLGIYFSTIIFGKDNDNDFKYTDNFSLPAKEKIKWFNGFKWKGIYIKVISNEKSKLLIKEIKALNYFYFDYLQLLEQYPYFQNNQLLYNIVFPIIAYSEINGFFLFSSVIINMNEFSEKQNYSYTISELIKVNDLIRNNNGVINFIGEKKNKNMKKENSFYINKNEKNIYDLENKYYINDLLNSELFSRINLYHFIRINKNKFLIFNLNEFIPKLFQLKINNDNKINYLSIINNKRVYYKFKYNNNIKTKDSNYNDFKNNYISTPREVLNKVYNIDPSITQMKSKDIIINNIYFRILYEAQCIKDNNYKNKQFVDYLYNYNNYNSNSTNNISENYIVEPYVIIYDLTDSIKLKYSLIKTFYRENNKNKNNNLNDIVNKLYFISTNYISFFSAWCEMLNKNSFNIKTYSDLKYNMNKYGISSQLKFFALININNPEIVDIIKISLLVKIIKFIFNKKDNDNILYKLNDIKNTNNIDLNKFSEYRKTKILYIIKCILYPNEIINQSKQFFNNLYEDLIFYVDVIFLKLKLIDGYLSLGLLNINKNNNINMNINNICKKISGFESPKDFLKHIIKVAREKPFLFLTEMEYKLKFIINPFIKFKSSISIESMSNKLELSHIYLNQSNRTYSYINSDEISGLILSKLIYYNTNNNSINNYYNNNKNNNNNAHKNDSNNEVLNKENNNNSNIALRPNFMKTNINLNNYKSPIKNKAYIFNSPQIVSDTESNNTKNDYLLQVKRRKSNELFVSMSDKKKILNNNEIYQLTNIMEKEICNNFVLELPSICYKMNYLFENYISKSKNPIYKYLKNIYFLPELKIIKKWQTYIGKLFYGISSSNGRIESSLLKSLIYLFIISFFFEKNFKEANQINMKIKDIFKKGNYQLSLVNLSIINLFQALSTENYIESEAPYSKCLLLLLMSYGETRGRNNDSHGIMGFPLWKIARKTRLEQKIINDYFKEMLQCLLFYEKKKSILKLNKTKGIFNYSSNVYNNVDNIKILKEIANNNNLGKINYEINEEYQRMSSESTITDILNNNISENPGLDFFTYLSKIINNFDIRLNRNIFDDIFLNKKMIKTFNFPPVSCNMEKLDKIFFQKEFILYFLKEIQSIFISEKLIYNEEYINTNISEEIFNPYPYNYNNKITYNSNESETNDDYTEENIHSKFNKKANNCAICTHKEKMQKLEKNDFFIFPSNTNFIYNFIEDKKNKTLKNKKIMNDSSLSSFNDAKRSSMVNSNIINEKIKNKNKSVESIQKRKINLFSHFLYQELLQKLSFKLNIQSGAVISFGNNTHNETSHDNYEKITLPRMIFKLKNIRIAHIYSGWEHNIFITNKGEIYSFGNNKHYQCGLPNEDNKDKIIKDPTNISRLNNNIKGITAACGNEHSLILSTKNEVYAFGNNEDGALGINDNKIKNYKFTKINFGKYTNKIKDISAGTVHSLALTNDNKIFSWGSSQGGQLGLTETYLLSQPGYKNSFVLSNPTLIEIISKNHKISERFLKIGCGEAHSVALNNKGKVYSWGFGSNGQLGLGFCEDSFEPGSGLYKSRRFTPEIIKYLEDETIIDIKCGKTFTMFINDKNELYACGVNDLNQLGLNEPCPKEHLINKEVSCYDFVFPTKVDCFLNMKVLKVSCGEGHCLAVIKDLISNIQTIWSWGNNNNGQLGQGSLVKKSTPNPINYLSDYNSKKFDDISCGGFHSLCLIKYRENLNWIEDDYIKIINTIDEIGII